MKTKRNETAENHYSECSVKRRDQVIYKQAQTHAGMLFAVLVYPEKRYSGSSRTEVAEQAVCQHNLRDPGRTAKTGRKRCSRLLRGIETPRPRTHMFAQKAVQRHQKSRETAHSMAGKRTVSVTVYTQNAGGGGREFIVFQTNETRKVVIYRENRE